MSAALLHTLMGFKRECYGVPRYRYPRPRCALWLGKALKAIWGHPGGMGGGAAILHILSTRKTGKSLRTHTRTKWFLNEPLSVCREQRLQAQKREEGPEGVERGGRGGRLPRLFGLEIDRLSPSPNLSISPSLLRLSLPPSLPRGAERCGENEGQTKI